MKRFLVLGIVAGLFVAAGCEKSDTVDPVAVTPSKGMVVALEDGSGPTIGEMAPEIEGVDLEGVAFKLSDYKGQVVMLDFYGDW